MGRRSGVTDDEESLSAFSLEKLDKEITRCKLRLKIPPSRVQEKSFEKRIHKLQRVRQRITATAG
jgi:hypothetical protein